jgi:hypothetical protein
MDTAWARRAAAEGQARRQDKVVLHRGPPPHEGASHYQRFGPIPRKRAVVERRPRTRVEQNCPHFGDDEEAADRSRQRLAKILISLPITEKEAVEQLADLALEKMALERRPQ